jgi:hypothetical protein
MQWFKVSRLTVVAVLAATACGLSQSTTATKEKAPPNEIRVALKSGRPVVLVVQPSGPAGTSEAYGDWAEYLNAFAARDKSVKIVKLSGRRYSELITSPQLDKPYNTLFLRDAGHALLYRGMILEPDIYNKGKEYMAGKPSPDPALRTGLEEVKLDIRP